MGPGPRARCASLVARASCLACALALSACAPSFTVTGFETLPEGHRGRAPNGRLTMEWSRRLAPEVEAPELLGGPFLPIERAVPALDPAHDRVFVGSSAGALWSFSGAGAEIWSYQAGGGIGSQPYVDPRNDELYFASDDGLLHALRASTGEVRWRAEVGGAVGRPPLATADALYVITDADWVIAFERATGESLWRYHRDAPEGFYVAEHAGLVMAGRRVLTGFTDGFVVALDASDGSVLWERDTTSDLPETDTLRFTDVDTTPVVIGDVVYAASFAGGLYSLELGSGTVRWLRSELTGVVGITEAPGGLLILSSGDLGVVAIRAADGEQVWRTPVTRGSPTVARVVDDMVMLGESEGGLVTLALADGAELGRIENGHGFAAPVELAAGLGAVVSNAGGLFVFRVE